jgi:leader peptidase (prepilin peptidase) / N-methyltransferase
VTLPWIIAAAAAGLLAGPRMRASVFARSTADGRQRRVCPECSRQVLAGRRRWCPVLPVTGRCPRCKARIGPDALAVELAAGLVLGVAAARASSAWELAALAWLAVLAVPLAFIDLAVRRLPDLLTVSAFTGTLVLLAVAEGTAGQPWPLVRALTGAAALAGFYLALWLFSPDQMGLGDVFPELTCASQQRCPLRKVIKEIREKAAGRACRGGLERSLIRRDLGQRCGPVLAVNPGLWHLARARALFSGRLAGCGGLAGRCRARRRRR